MEEKSAKKIIEAIKKDKIRPKRKWHFVAKSLAFWLILSIFILLASLFLSLAILSFIDFDLELLRALHLGRYVRLMVHTAPYLWMLLLLGSIILGYYVFRKTKRGYRYSMILVAMIMLLVVSILGVSAHFARVNERMEQAISQGLPPLHRLVPPRGHRFFRPEEGMLAGKIIEKENSEFKLQTPKDEVWGVIYNKETIYQERDLQVGNHMIVVIGEKTGNKEFIAEQIKRMREYRKKIEEREGVDDRMPLPSLEGRARKMRKMH